MAARYDLAVEQGATFRRSFAWQDSATPPNPLPFTGYAARMQVRSEPGAVLLLTLTSPAGGLVFGTGDSANVLTLTLTADQTALLTSGASYDLFVEASDSIRFLYGLVRLTPAVTQGA